MANHKCLYKYLDAKGALMMLFRSNLQFTNATRLNDPFDCHPSLINFSNVPNEKCHGWSPDVISMVESNQYERYRDSAWICSLSKNYDSLLMWSYYNSHKGVCIGLDMEKVKQYLSRIMNGVYIGAREFEVQYKDIIEKPDYFRDYQDFFKYQISTKAKAWEHEQEVRLLLIDPMPATVLHHPCFAVMDLPYKPKDNDWPIDYRELRAYAEIGCECFESVYLGINIDKDEKAKLIKLAKKLNPEIEIYQMNVDPEAFRLKAELKE